MLAGTVALAGVATVREVERQTYLDGLRGIAALVVLFGHIMIALFPTVVTQNPDDAHSRFDLITGFLPVGFLWNGNFAVCIFFVLSGYVLSGYSVHSRLSFLADVLRRYLRLALPMLIISTAAWLLMRLGLYFNGEASEITRSGWLGGWYRFAPNFVDMVSEALYGAFASGRNAYNPNLWTMQFELQGSLYVFLIWALFTDRGIRLMAVLLFALVHVADYYLLFAAGVLLYDRGSQLIALPQRWKATAKRGESLGFGLVALGLLLGSLPFVINAPGAGWLARHNAPHIIQAANAAIISPVYRHAEWVHGIGAIVLFAGLLLSSRIKRALGSAVPAFLGRISFVLYLINIPVVCSVLSWVVIYFPYDTPYPERAAYAAVITVAAALAISAYIADFVDGRMTLLSRQAGWLFDRRFATGAGGS